MVSGNDDKTAGTTESGAEFDRLARRYLDLWQAQLSGLASDQAVMQDSITAVSAASAEGSMLATTDPTWMTSP